jgi:hypothetical protein
MFHNINKSSLHFGVRTLVPLYLFHGLKSMPRWDFKLKKRCLIFQKNILVKGGFDQFKLGRKLYFGLTIFNLPKGLKIR